MIHVQTKSLKKLHFNGRKYSLILTIKRILGYFNLRFGNVNYIYTIKENIYKFWIYQFIV